MFSNKEGFTEMADVTAKKPGLIGKLLVTSLIVVSVAITAFVGTVIVGNLGSQSYIKADQYQMVLLTNGSLYFGKLANIDKQYATLTDVYFLRTPTDPTKAKDSIDLVKRTNVGVLPEDQLMINTDEIVTWDNVKATSPVVVDGILKQKAEEKAAAEKASTSTTETTPATQ